MPRGRRPKNNQDENAPIVENINVGVSYEERLLRLKQEKEYYAFKYVKNKQGSYDGMYFCCNCKTTMTRLVKNWNKEIDVCGFGPFERTTKDIKVPSFEEINKRN